MHAHTHTNTQQAYTDVLFGLKVYILDHGRVLGVLKVGPRLLVGLVSCFGFTIVFTPQINGGAASSLSSSQSSVVFVFTQVLTGI